MRRTGPDRALADDFGLCLDSENDRLGHDAYWPLDRSSRDAFPDLEVTVEDADSEGDKTALHLRLRGPHEASFLGVDPTGERVDVTRTIPHHLDDRRITETGIPEATIGVLQQHGVTLSWVLQYPQNPERHESLPPPHSQTEPRFAAHNPATDPHTRIQAPQDSTPSRERTHLGLLDVGVAEMVAG